jgi:hypothetical protein
LDGLGNVVFQIESGSGLISSASYAYSASHAEFATTAAYAATYSYVTQSNVPYNGVRAIKRSPYSGLNVGGTTVEEFLDNFFFPFQSATIAINAGTSYYETGTSQNITVNVTVTANDETVFGSGSVKKSGVVWNTFATIPPYTPSFTDTGLMANDTYIAYAEIDNSGAPTIINSSTKTISFIYPFLYGMSANPNLDSGSLYTTLTKSVTAQGSKTINLVDTAVYIYYAYPASYGSLTSIIDPNTFNITSDFTATNMAVTSSGLTSNWSSSLKVYRLNNLANPNGNFQFNF